MFSVFSIELIWDNVMSSSSDEWKDDKRTKMRPLQHQFVMMKEGGPHTTAPSRGAASCGAIDHGFALRIICKADRGDIEQIVVEQVGDWKSGHRATRRAPISWSVAAFQPLPRSAGKALYRIHVRWRDRAVQEFALPVSRSLLIIGFRNVGENRWELWNLDAISFYQLRMCITVKPAQVEN
jgi:hypothetical protein